MRRPVGHRTAPKRARRRTALQHVMIPSVAAHEGGTVLDALYHQLLQRGVQYFLPSSHLEIVGSASPSASEIVCESAPEGGLTFKWLAKRYLVTNHQAFS